MTSNPKSTCYSCKYRGSVPGSAHSSCSHPSIKQMGGELAALLLMARGYGPTDLNMDVNPHGWKSGWFNWPMDFDPVWLEKCGGYTQKENITMEQQ